jgi:hypothetical protein
MKSQNDYSSPPDSQRDCVAHHMRFVCTSVSRMSTLPLISAQKDTRHVDGALSA